MAYQFDFSLILPFAITGEHFNRSVDRIIKVLDGTSLVGKLFLSKMPQRIQLQVTVSWFREPFDRCLIGLGQRVAMAGGEIELQWKFATQPLQQADRDQKQHHEARIDSAQLPLFTRSRLRISSCPIHSPASRSASKRRMPSTRKVRR